MEPEPHCGLCKKEGVKLYTNTYIDKRGNKCSWKICTACATTRQLIRHYRKKSIHELEEMRIKMEKRLASLVSVLNQRIIESSK